MTSRRATVGDGLVPSRLEFVSNFVHEAETGGHEGRPYTSRLEFMHGRDRASRPVSNSRKAREGLSRPVPSGSHDSSTGGAKPRPYGNAREAICSAIQTSKSSRDNVSCRRTP